MIGRLRNQMMIHKSSFNRQYLGDVDLLASTVGVMEKDQDHLQSYTLIQFSFLN